MRVTRSEEAATTAPICLIKRDWHLEPFQTTVGLFKLMNCWPVALASIPAWQLGPQRTPEALAAVTVTLTLERLSGMRSTSTTQ